MEARMKKSLMIATSLIMSSAGLAQTTAVGSEAGVIRGGYPACSATVTDSCIQLYERGVRNTQNLAMNETSGASSTAMGGPYEPVADHANAGMAATSEAGVGGPIEARTGYPPCRHSGPGEDSCIQLYERGVTGH
jgi:hypothetical protein